jgi:cyclic beta-1,2-glucan synthetase
MADQSSGDIAQMKSADNNRSIAQPAENGQRDKLGQVAQELAATLIADQPSGSRFRGQVGLPLLQYLKDYETLLLEAYEFFQGAAGEHLSLSYAAEWMLDNYYIVQQAIREIGENLPPGFYHELPIVRQGAFSGYPRIYAIANEYLSLEQYQLDISRLESFIEAFQAKANLTMGELWALSSTLRVVMVQALVYAVAQLTGLNDRLEVMQKGRSFFKLEVSTGTANDDIVANCIISLRTLSTYDWKDFFEASSLVERTLGKDPAMLYSRMESSTRDRYRKATGDLARVSGKAELEVAVQVVELANKEYARSGSTLLDLHPAGSPNQDVQQVSGDNPTGLDAWRGLTLPRQCHVGYFLVDKGRLYLERRIGYTAPLSQRIRRWIHTNPTLVYIGSITLLSLSVSSFLLAYAVSAGGTMFQVVIIGLLSLLLSSTVAVSFVNWLVTNSIGPRQLPKLNFDEGIPQSCSTLVVIPAMLTDIAEVDSLVQQLELHYLRNPDLSLSFALLTDLADAQEDVVDGDEEIVNYASDGILQLNRKYDREGDGPFLLLHRSRKWNPQEGVWMGWERKRGKLHELNRLILGDGDHSFTHQVGDLSLLSTVRYVITLDADTILPGQSARRLAATLAHPLNRAELDPRSGRVRAGYTVLQPRIEISPASANKSLFTRIFSGDVGLDLYTLAVSDVYQDLFGEGIYIGKGIYDVANFERSLQGVVPENALLSHDLFEGIHGRVGLISDVSLIEEYPHNYLVHMSRAHRWIRGDWQLLPWLMPRVPASPTTPEKTSSRPPNRLLMIDRWKIFDNLRRSLVPPGLLLFLLAGWIWMPGSPLLWTLVGIFSLAVPFLTSILSVAISVLGDQDRTHPLSIKTRPIRDDFFRWLLALTFLPYEALLAVDAIVLTLLRLYVTRRNLLQWVTAAKAATQYRVTHGSYPVWIRMGVTLILVLGIGVMVIFNEPLHFLIALPVLTVWLLSPQVAFAISRPILWEAASLNEDQQNRLRALARRTWLYFEQYVGPEDHWLPPDHYQESPRGNIAHRTSPTNIGLSLLSTLAAYDFGYTGILELAARLNATFENISRLEKHRGHLLNWYDTRSLEPLSPRYVSTVDSGNLAGSLVALGQGSLEIGDQPILRQATCDGFLDTLDLMVELIEGLEQEDARQAAALLQDVLLQIRQRIVTMRGNPQDWAPYLLLMSAAPLPGKVLDKSVLSLQLLEQRVMEFVDDAAYLLGADTLSRLRIYSGRVRYHLESIRRKIEMLLPWVVSYTNPPALFESDEVDQHILDKWEAIKQTLTFNVTLKDVGEAVKAAQLCLHQLEELLGETQASAGLVDEAQKWCAWLQERLASAGMVAKALWISFVDLHQQCEQMVREMDFSFLFDHERQIFHIGFNLELGKLDANYYDLLASEARIASLIAIARGQVPQSHWLHLSRPFTQVDGARVLLSWSATMFEYLMPDLLLRNYEGTLLYESSRAAVDHQIRYGEHKHVPWGISESSYYHFDDNMVYQYRAFGVPGLGFKRGLSEDLVISPYASLLALPLRPGQVVENLENLKKLGMIGTYGLYEAIDFTPTRVGMGQDGQIVRSYMAHHQGMILLSLDNYFKKNTMVERFHADPHIRSVELLLQEQVPKFAPFEQPHAQDGRALPPEEASVDLAPWRVLPEPPQPRVHYLSNGQYSLMISSSGAGFSSWQDINLTRFQTDTSLNNWGTWIYVKEQGTEDAESIWSPALQPVGMAGDRQEVLFFPHQVEFLRRDQDISMMMEITVPPDDDLEIRRISLTNHSDRPRQLSLTSYGEVVLGPVADDHRHPAFSKLFIESEYIEDQQTLLFRRRPRSSQDKTLMLAHTFILERADSMERERFSCETDRARFVGRGRTLRNPQALQATGSQAGRLSNTTGATLDPIMAIRYEFSLEPHSSMQAAFITSASDSRQDSLSLISRYRDWHIVERAFDQARASSELEMRRLGLDSSTLEKYQKILSLLLYPHAALRAEACQLAANQAGQPTLWAYGISGDYPILLVKVKDQEDSSLVRQLLLAHVYWRQRGLLIDLVLLNVQGSDYGQELSGHLRRLISTSNSEGWMNRRGGIFLVNLDRMREVDRTLLETVARVILEGEKGALEDQLEKMESTPTRLPVFAPIREQFDEEAIPPINRPADLKYDNGYGGFSQDGSEYVIYLEPGQFTPAPWVNVIANSDFGFLVSESGGGYTWAVNSGENRLSPWNNDPISDPPGEVLYFRDEETAEVWTPTPLPAPAPAPYLIRHRAGCTTFEHHSHGLKQHLRLFVPPDEPVKIIQVRLENNTGRVRRITATYFVEWVLGLNREATQPYIIPEYDSESQALLAINPYNTEFAERVAFLASDRHIHALTADRTEFLGRLGTFDRPAALSRIGLTGRVEAGLDPCAALQVHIDLHPGDTEEFYFLLGQGENRARAVELIQRFQNRERVSEALQNTLAEWDRILGAVQVKTPDPAMDLLLNRWLLYQSLSCRIWGRSGFYQSSGAYGFRDQLQDILSVIHAAPEVARAHILRAARHQFEAGDVLHWWHPPSGRGVRTRYSDDLLWLPYVVAHYVKTTGDQNILDEQVPFLQGPPLEKDEKERYGHYEVARQAHSLYEHCQRVFEKGSTSGPHHLPLMGAGDWNDGMNRVGIQGRGESIWLAWFLSSTLERFADLCNLRGDTEHAKLYLRRAGEYRLAVEEHAWDGKWYLRAFYDDGTALGSSQNRECQIDAIAQSWAVLSGAGQPERAAQAMQSVSEHLVLPEERLLLLFSPPFNKTPRDPGYIKGYLPGVRENGGQYTHAALWTIWAFAQLGQGDYANSLFRMINPIYHADSKEKVERYHVEPYVIAADVYGREPHIGRGGWTWYTGSAGWMYRLGLEGLLGLQKEGDSILFNPCIPSDWKEYSITYRHAGTLYQITVENPTGVSQGVKQVILDGQHLTNGRIPLVLDGGTHQIRVVMGDQDG